ncbi:ChbG/HpnK family deacetylase [Paenibacillus sp. OAS669]|uniref:ChbG/HpnK family deacetylase n=1 Tax=Paenibacillus sp. OAS669 TaxID=2663821 RepID=UPI00178AD116|nr:ChbG/HpnK family deacetylase [Paenibacillus sp. OAS669]MBE1446695.1 putative glycoside hydrolase/deacetylase ChbG (UPF0249 family) [Paenibacillus sp. OAS669]
MLFTPGDRYVIINAGDFGISDSANQAIMEMFHSGAITSASIMMTGERARAAAAFCRRHPSVRVGIIRQTIEQQHLRLISWKDIRDGRRFGE